MRQFSPLGGISNFGGFGAAALFARIWFGSVFSCGFCLVALFLRIWFGHSTLIEFGLVFWFLRILFGLVGLICTVGWLWLDYSEDCCSRVDLKYCHAQISTQISETFINNS